MKTMLLVTSRVVVEHTTEEGLAEAIKDIQRNKTLAEHVGAGAFTYWTVGNPQANLPPRSP
jgi:hypothetical protein